MYLAVPIDSQNAFAEWERVGGTPTQARKYVRHIKLPYPVSVKVDGRTGRGVILRGRSQGIAGGS
jgi:hypothetical protein